MSDRPLPAADESSVHCTVHRLGSGEIRRTQRGDVSVFACRGEYSAGLMEVLERTLVRAGGDLGLDLRALSGLRPGIVSSLKRLNRTFAEEGRVLLLYDPPGRLLDLLELDGSRDAFSVFRSQDGLQPAARATVGVAGAAHAERVSQSIVHFERKLERAEELESTLDSARRLSLRNLLRPLPAFSPFHFSTAYVPHDKVGGDFFSLVPLDEDRMGIAIGDVSGHGLEAALLMGMARKVVEMRAAETVINGPDSVLRKVNRDLFPELDRFTFITSLYGILTRSSGRFEFSRAGHTYPLVVSPSRGDVRTIESSGIALGLDDGALFEDSLQRREETLAPGDVLILYTDGLVEAEHPRRGQFGAERFADVAAGVTESMSVEEIRDHLLKEIKQFLDGVGLADDLTLVCVRRGGEALHLSPSPS